MAELADALASGASGGNTLRGQGVVFTRRMGSSPIDRTIRNLKLRVISELFLHLNTI